MKKQTRLLFLLCAVMLFGALLGCGKAADDAVAVTQISMLLGAPEMQVNRYGGVVVSKTETTIEKAENHIVAEILVKEGDAVSEGQVLFTYDTADMQLALDKALLEKEQLANQISTFAEQISQLESERRGASASQQLSYTVEIQSLQLDQKEAQYNLSLKEQELHTLEASLENNEVTSPINGTVQTLNANDETDQNGMPLPFMTIVERGVFRVKGSVSELNMGEISEGLPVIIRARMGEGVWRGAVESILFDQPEQSENSYGMVTEVVGADSPTTSSSYPFYIDMESTDGLKLGQHVTVEPDYGQADDTELTLDAGYVVLTDSGAYVWAASKRSTLEKRAVTLGEKDAELNVYPILEGLTASDYIAFPAKDLAEGMRVTYYDDSAFEEAEEVLEEETVGAEEEELFVNEVSVEE